MEIHVDDSTFRRYLYFWSGQIASLLGSSIAQFVIIWWVTLQTESPIFLSLAAFIGFLPVIILSPFAGVLADRWSRKKLSGVTDFLQALATGVLIFLFWSDLVSIGLVLVVLGIRGVFQAFHQPVVSAIIPTMVPQDKLSRMNGLNTFFIGVINLLGPVIAAILLTVLALHEILWIDVVTFLIALVPLLLIAIPSVRRSAEPMQARPSFFGELGIGLGFIRKARGLLPLILTATMLNFLIAPLVTLLPYYVRVDHFGGAEDLAFVMAFLGAGAVGGGLMMSLIRGFKRKMLTGVIFIYVIFLGYAIIALSPTGLFWMMAIGGLILAFAPPGFNVSMQTILQTVVPLQMLGRVSSVLIALATAAMPIGMIVAGPLAQITGTANLYLMCAIAGVAVLTVSWLFTDMRHVEDMQSAPPQVEAPV